MPVVMILRGLPTGQATPYDGQYLKDFDFGAYDGRGSITLTTDLKDAKRFPSTAEAFAFYQTVPTDKPVREDGQPNKPLTATNWEMRVIGLNE